MAALVSSIEDVRLRNAVKAQIALQMSGLQPSPIDPTTFVSGEPEGGSGRTNKKSPESVPTPGGRSAGDARRERTRG